MSTASLSARRPARRAAARAIAGLARQLVEHERHGRGGRVVPGEQQRHHLVADLQVAQRVGVLVLGVEQQAEDVAAALAGRRGGGRSPSRSARRACARRLQPPPRRAAAAQDAQEVVAGVERRAPPRTGRRHRSSAPVVRPGRLRTARASPRAPPDGGSTRRGRSLAPGWSSSSARVGLPDRSRRPRRRCARDGTPAA